MSDPTIPDWINAGAACVGAIAVVIGLWGANSKINEAQRTARQLRQSQVSEDLIFLAHNIADALRDIRNPLDRIPKEKMEDRQYAYQKRYERIVHYAELFDKLREAQIRTRAIIGDQEVDTAVSDLFKVRSKVVVAIQELAELADVSNKDLNHENRLLIVELRRDLYGNFPRKMV